MKFCASLALITSVLLGWGVPAAYASSPLTPATSYQDIDASTYTGSLDSFGSLTVQTIQNGGGVVASLNVVTSYTSNELAVTAVGSADYGSALVEDSGFAQFYFRVDGPQGSTPVPIILQASATTVNDEGLTGRDSTVIARVGLMSSGNQVIADSCYGASEPQAILCAGLTDPTSFDEDIDGSILPNVEGSVFEAWTIDDFDFVHMSIDPMVSIDPTWALANPGYTLSFSPSISGTVPEPATWTIMMLGLGGIGAALRSRRRNTLSAPARRPTTDDGAANTPRPA